MPPQETKALDRIMVSLKLKKPQGGLTREQAMAAWPVRNPDLVAHEHEDGSVAVELPRRKDWVGGALGFLFFVPDSKPVQLDEVGSFVWKLCDGEHTVNEIADALAAEYKLNRREVDVSLTQYLQTLGKRGMIAFAIPRDVAEEAGLSGSASFPGGEAGEAETPADEE
ncbi:MAG: PqqD family protein [Armatimonadota bacterium]